MTFGAIHAEGTMGPWTIIADLHNALTDDLSR